MTFKMGKTSKTGYNFLKNSNAFINICYGAVRSGKTIICTFRFLQHILLSKHEKFLLCGKNRDTIERNIINDFIDIIEQYYTVDYNKIDGKIHINTREGVKTCYIVGLNDERVTDKIKGMTVAGAYVDELTTVPKSAFEMLTTRCSLPDSKIFCTTNPASPYHWVYTDYIANEELIKSDTVKSWQFRIDENPHLTNEYIKRMKTLYPPNTPYYKQYILGEWTIAEGIIYEHFNNDNIIDVNTIPNRFDRLDVGCDYGVSAPNCFSLVGTVFKEDGNDFYVLDEVYFDPQKEGRVQTDSERIQDLIGLLNKWGSYMTYTNKGTIWFPHDAISLKEEANRHFDELGMYVNTFKPDVIECISVIQDLTYKNKLFVCENCIELINQFYTYSWDSKKQEKGTDYPLMINDHAVDSIRAPIMRNRSNAIIGLAEFVDLWGSPNRDNVIYRRRLF